jgi:hypothetical protein
VKKSVLLSVCPERSTGEEAWGEKVEGIIKWGKILFWYILIPIVQKGKTFVTFALVSTYGTTTIWSYIKKLSTGMVDEKVTVISSFSTLLFLLLKLGMP